LSNDSIIVFQILARAKAATAMELEQRASPELWELLPPMIGDAVDQSNRTSYGKERSPHFQYKRGHQPLFGFFFEQSECNIENTTRW